MNVALIPLRKGSKGIPGKNMKIMAGKPLCHWVIEAALGANRIDEVWISTDYDSNIMKGVHCHKRPKVLASDDASTDDVLYDFALYHEFDKVVLLQATNPMTTSEDINGVLKLSEECCYPIVSVVNLGHRFAWGRDRPKNYDVFKRPLRQSIEHAEPLLIENGAFYLNTRKDIIASKCRLGLINMTYEMPYETLVEIDTQEDWDIVERNLQCR